MDKCDERCIDLDTERHYTFMRVIKEDKNKWRDNQSLFIDQETQYC